MLKTIHNYGCVLPSLSLIDAVSLAGAATDAFVMRALEGAGFAGLRVRHGYVFQRLLVEPTSITELGAVLGVTQQAMSKTIAELTSLGYVAATVDPADARRRVLSLTPHGIGAVEEARAARRRLESVVEAAVGSERLAATHATLWALLEQLGLSDQVAARAVPDPAPLE
jgi:DNA-binding MarR family transcriptional regulator